MRQGMRYKITVQRLEAVPNEYGTEVEQWGDLSTLRAEVVERAAVAVESETAGTQGRERVTFRTRTYGGVTLADRVIWRGTVYELRELRGGDFSEGRALELVCEGGAQ